jgi:hypothetical protein
MLTGLIMVIVNILLITALIAVICCYIKCDRVSNSICIDSTDIVMKLNKRVTNLDAYRTTVLLRCNIPTSNSFAHWFIVATLEDNTQIALSTSRSNIIHVLLAKPFMSKLCKLKCISKNTIEMPLTLNEVINFEHKLITHTVYDIINFNCQDIVYHTMRHYCKPNLCKPVHGLKLLRTVCNELSDDV